MQNWSKHTAKCINPMLIISANPLRESSQANRHCFLCVWYVDDVSSSQTCNCFRCENVWRKRGFTFSVFDSHGQRGFFILNAPLSWRGPLSVIELVWLCELQMLNQNPLRLISSQTTGERASKQPSGFSRLYANCNTFFVFKYGSGKSLFDISLVRRNARPWNVRLRWENSGFHWALSNFPQCVWNFQPYKYSAIVRFTTTGYWQQQ